MTVNLSLQQAGLSHSGLEAVIPHALRTGYGGNAKRLQQAAWRRAPEKRCRHHQCRAAVAAEETEVGWGCLQPS